MTARTEAQCRQAFDEAYGRHRERVVRWSRRFERGDLATAEDVAQDVFTRLWESLPTLEARGELGGWLHEVTQNLLRSRARQLATAAQAHALAPLPLHDGGSSDGLDESADRRWVRLAVDALPELERLVVWLKYFDGLEQREIARRLGRSDGYVSKVASAAVSRLRDVALAS